MRSLALAIVLLAGVVQLLRLEPWRTAEERLSQAALDDDLPEARRLLHGGADADGSPGATSTPLFWAARKGDLELARLLIDR